MWSGLVVVVALILAQGVLMRMVPGLSPALEPEEVKQHFIDRENQILLGCLIQIIFWTLWATWTMGLAVLINKMEEGRRPYLTYCSVALNGGGYVFFLLIPTTWAALAFRAETLPAWFMQSVNDWVWLIWLYTWPPFAVFMFVVGIAVLMDKAAEPLWPRWVGYYNIWCGIFIFPAGLIAFFKEGLFAYDGVGAFWLPVFVFFGWIMVMTWLGFQGIAKIERQEQAALKAQGANVAA